MKTLTTVTLAALTLTLVLAFQAKSGSNTSSFACGGDTNSIVSAECGGGGCTNAPVLACGGCTNNISFALVNCTNLTWLAKCGDGCTNSMIF